MLTMQIYGSYGGRLFRSVSRSTTLIFKQRRKNQLFPVLSIVLVCHWWQLKLGSHSIRSIISFVIKSSTFHKTAHEEIHFQTKYIFQLLLQASTFFRLNYGYLQTRFCSLNKSILSNQDLQTIIQQKTSRKKQGMITKQLWTEQQDEFLRKFVPKKGRVDWTKVMESLNSHFGRKQRSAKQCRERYINYSKFQSRNNQSSKWRPQQLQILFQQFNKLGPRWNTISKYLPEKSGNAIKNRFYGGLRKIIRNMNRMDKEQKGKIKKKLKYESVVRIIEAPQCLCNLDTDLKRQSFEIRQKLVSLISKSQEISQKDASALISQINKFNLNTRSYRTKRRKNYAEQDEAQDEMTPKDVNVGQTSVISSEKSKSGVGQIKMGDRCLDEKKETGNIEDQNQISNKQKDILPIFSPTLKQFQRLDMGNDNQFDSYILSLFPEQHSPLENQDLI